MGSVSLESVQKLLHLDVDYPQFPSYEHFFEFLVDAVAVKAVAKVSWRRIAIYITEPIEIIASDCQPPLFALGVMMIRRREILARDGKSDLDDYIDKAKIAYRRHVTYLRLKPEIDIAQEEFLSVFRGELDSLKTIEVETKAHVDLATSILRKKFKSGAITQKDFQIQMKKLKEEAFNAHMPYWTLFRQVEMELEEIKDSMINQELSKEQKPV